MTTPNLGLSSTSQSSGSLVTFLNWRLLQDADNPNSNMGKIDAWAGLVSASLIEIINEKIHVIYASGNGTAYSANETDVVSYFEDLTINLAVDVTNTGVMTLDINGLGNKFLKKMVGGVRTDLTAGDLQAGFFNMFIYNSGEFVWIGYQSTAMHTNTSGEINSLTGKTTPVDADILVTEDSASSFAKKKLTWANLKATLKTYFDTLYANIFHTHPWSQITDHPISSYYLEDTPADIATYSQLIEIPSGGTEDVDTVSVVLADGEKLIESYVTYPITGLSGTILMGGNWEFATYASVSNDVGTSEIIIRVYTRTSGSAETELFNFSTGEINGATATEYLVDTTHPDYIINPTDRLVVKYFAKTSTAASVNVSLYHNGTLHYTHFHLPGAPVGATGGDVSTDAIWVAKGDLIVGKGSASAVRLPVGVTNGLTLLTDSTTTEGIKWASYSASGVDTTAIHTNVTGEIAGLTNKVTPADADAFILESFADSNAKRYSLWSQFKTTLKAYFDGLYATSASGVTNGNAHDHAGGDGGQISHTSLSNIGTLNHIEIDNHILSGSSFHGTTGLSEVTPTPISSYTVSGSSGSSTKLARENHTHQISGSLTLNNVDMSGSLVVSGSIITLKDVQAGEEVFSAFGKPHEIRLGGEANYSLIEIGKRTRANSPAHAGIYFNTSGCGVPDTIFEMYHTESDIGTGKGYGIFYGDQFSVIGSLTSNILGSGTYQRGDIAAAYNIYSGSGLLVGRSIPDSGSYVLQQGDIIAKRNITAEKDLMIHGDATIKKSLIVGGQIVDIPDGSLDVLGSITSGSDISAGINTISARTLVATGDAKIASGLVVGNDIGTNNPGNGEIWLQEQSALPSATSSVNKLINYKNIPIFQSSSSIRRYRGTSSDILTPFMQYSTLRALWYGMIVQGAAYIVKDKVSNHDLTIVNTMFESSYQNNSMFPVMSMNSLSTGNNYLSYATASNLLPTNYIGAFGWFYVPSTGAVVKPIFNCGSTVPSWTLYVYNNGLQSVVYNTSATAFYCGGINLTANAWNFIGMSFYWASAGNYSNKVYANGTWGDNSTDPGSITRAPTGAFTVFTDGTNYSNDYRASAMIVGSHALAANLAGYQIEYIYESTKAFYGQ